MGAAYQVAEQLPLALRPEAPEEFVVAPPPGPTGLKDEVDRDLNGLFYLLAAISLLAGAFGIANTTLVSVMERVPEIGLRRALGAQRRAIALQFLAESALLGFFGGLVGTSIGVISVVGTSIYSSWTPVIAAWVVVAGPVVGGLTGLVAGAYPASRAARIEPATALRSNYP